MNIPDFTVSTFYGVNTSIKDKKTLKKGVATDSVNWITGADQDHIELRRGTALLGSTRQTGAGRITGVGVGTRKDGTQVLFFSHGQKIKYYDDATDDTIEIGSDLLGADAYDKDTWFTYYDHLAGAFVYVGNEYTSTKKIPVANPDTARDQQNSERYGIMRSGQGRMFAGRLRSQDGNKLDATSFYFSHIDHSTFAQYTLVSAEAVGSSGSTTYSGTLAAVTGVPTCFLVTIKEASGETISDNGDGTLTGNQGSTGTINYATGAYSVTFNHPTSGAITADYYWEDATSGGVLDFSYSTPRTAGEGDVMPEPGTGPIMAIFPFLTVEYAFHTLQTWVYTSSVDDLSATNLPYRAIGIPSTRAAYPTSDGILLIDTSNPSEPKVRRMQLNTQSDTSVIPVSLSDALDLSGYAFDKAVAYRWGDYEIICVAKDGDNYNSVMYVRNVRSGAWDKLEYYASCLGSYNGTLIAGDSISNNVFTLFSGFDDDDSVIANRWRDGYQDLGTSNKKRTHLMRVRGLIQPTQRIKVLLSLDEGNYTEVYTIDGQGDYVDHGINTSIGAYIIGSKVIGGGGDATAHPFDVTFDVHTDKYRFISTQFEALDVGYAAIFECTYKDNRDKGR